MAEYKHGSMDITNHQRDYEGFIRLAGWVCVVALLVLVFLAVFNS